MHPPTPAVTEAPERAPANHHERRANAAFHAKRLRRSRRVESLSARLCYQWGFGELSRKEAQRRLRAEVLRLYGRTEAVEIGARLMTMKEFTALPEPEPKAPAAVATRVELSADDKRKARNARKRLRQQRRAHAATKPAAT